MTEAREIVYNTLKFTKPKRAPRQIWDLPWTYTHFPDEIKKLKELYPEDIVWLGGIYKQPPFGGRLIEKICCLMGL